MKHKLFIKGMLQVGENFLVARTIDGRAFVRSFAADGDKQWHELVLEEETTEKPDWLEVASQRP